ncbi:MAG TPA: biotin-dependent carboxyltransferase family protein [Ramlibacter sp.]|nr:biotin-dependent carboxyltransferase family protein [Ramlibacter sp.]
MTPSLLVRQPGIHTTVQDRGRIGFQDVGVPVSGPLDVVSLALANALVGNVPATPALEMLLQGPTLEVACDSVRVALVGSDAALEIGGANARRVAPGTSARLVRGETLTVARLGASACACLAVQGGIQVARCLGSAATYVRGRLGGVEGRALRAGDSVPLALEAVPTRGDKRMAQALDLALDQVIRVVLGPQADFFTEAAIETFLASDYVVSTQADRMGFRLDGPALQHAKGYNIVSDGIVAGAIQVPGSGLPIVLMADAQTTGGYPKIATVISADIPVLGRRKPGSRVRFAAVSVAEAEALHRSQQADIGRHIAALRDAAAPAIVDVAALHTVNLISGVASARCEPA